MEYIIILIFLTTTFQRGYLQAPPLEAEQEVAAFLPSNTPRRYIPTTAELDKDAGKVKVTPLSPALKNAQQYLKWIQSDLHSVKQTSPLEEIRKPKMATFSNPKKLPVDPVVGSGLPPEYQIDMDPGIYPSDSQTQTGPTADPIFNPSDQFPFNANTEVTGLTLPGTVPGIYPAEPRDPAQFVLPAVTKTMEKPPPSFVKSVQAVKTDQNLHRLENGQGQNPNMRQQLQGQNTDMRQQLQGQNSNMRQQLQGQIPDMRQQLQVQNPNMRQRLQGQNPNMRQQLQGQNPDMRQQLKSKKTPFQQSKKLLVSRANRRPATVATPSQRQYTGLRMNMLKVPELAFITNQDAKPEVKQRRRIVPLPESKPDMEVQQLFGSGRDKIISLTRVNRKPTEFGNAKPKVTSNLRAVPKQVQSRLNQISNTIISRHTKSQPTRNLNAPKSKQLPGQRSIRFNQNSAKPVQSRALPTAPMKFTTANGNPPKPNVILQRNQTRPKVTALSRSRQVRPLPRSREVSPVPRSKDVRPVPRSRNVSPVPRSRDVRPLPGSKEVKPLPLIRIQRNNGGGRTSLGRPNQEDLPLLDQIHEAKKRTRVLEQFKKQSNLMDGDQENGDSLFNRRIQTIQNLQTASATEMKKALFVSQNKPPPKQTLESLARLLSQQQKPQPRPKPQQEIGIRIRAQSRHQSQVTEMKAQQQSQSRSRPSEVPVAPERTKQAPPNGPKMLSLSKSMDVSKLAAPQKPEIITVDNYRSSPQTVPPPVEKAAPPPSETFPHPPPLTQHDQRPLRPEVTSTRDFMGQVRFAEERQTNPPNPKDLLNTYQPISGTQLFPSPKYQERENQRQLSSTSQKPIQGQNTVQISESNLQELVRVYALQKKQLAAEAPKPPVKQEPDPQSDSAVPFSDSQIQYLMGLLDSQSQKIPSTPDESQDHNSVPSERRPEPNRQRPEATRSFDQMQGVNLPNTFYERVQQPEEAQPNTVNPELVKRLGNGLSILAGPPAEDQRQLIPDGGVYQVVMPPVVATKSVVKPSDFQGDQRSNTVKRIVNSLPEFQDRQIPAQDPMFSYPVPASYDPQSLTKSLYDQASLSTLKKQPSVPASPKINPFASPQGPQAAYVPPQMQQAPQTVTYQINPALRQAPSPEIRPPIPSPPQADPIPVPIPNNQAPMNVMSTSSLPVGDQIPILSPSLVSQASAMAVQRNQVLVAKSAQNAQLPYMVNPVPSFRPDQTIRTSVTSTNGGSSQTLGNQRTNPASARRYQAPVQMSSMSIQAAQMSSQVNQGRAPPDINQGRAPLDINHGRAPLDINQGRAPLDINRGRAPLHPNQGRAPPNINQGRSPLDINQGRSTLDINQGRSPPNINQGRSTLDINQGRSPLDINQGRSTLDINQGRPPLDINQGRPPLDINQGRAPLDPNQGRAPLDPNQGRSPPNINQGRSPLNINQGRAPPEINQGRAPPAINQMTGQPGPNQMTSQPGPNQMIGQPGPNQMIDQPGPNQMTGQPEPNQMIGQPGPNQMIGQPGPNQIISQPGPNQMKGQPGPNQMTGQSGPIQITGQMTGQPGPNQMTVQPGPNQMTGQSGPIQITGQMTGQPGPNQMTVQPGPNQMTGQPGPNQMNGQTYAGINKALPQISSRTNEMTEQLIQNQMLRQQMSNQLFNQQMLDQMTTRQVQLSRQQMFNDAAAGQTSYINNQQSPQVSGQVPPQMSLQNPPNPDQMPYFTDQASEQVPTQTLSGINQMPAQPATHMHDIPGQYSTRNDPVPVYSDNQMQGHMDMGPDQALTQAMTGQIQDQAYLQMNQQPNQGYSDTNQGYSDTNVNQGYPNMHHGYTDTNQGYSDTNTNQGYSNTNQGYSNTNQGYLDTNQGYSNTNQPYSNTNQGYTDTNQGYSDMNQGYLNTKQGYPDTNQAYSDTNQALLEATVRQLAGQTPSQINNQDPNLVSSMGSVQNSQNPLIAQAPEASSPDPGYTTEIRLVRVPLSQLTKQRQINQNPQGASLPQNTNDQMVQNGQNPNYMVLEQPQMVNAASTGSSSLQPAIQEQPPSSNVVLTREQYLALQQAVNGNNNMGTTQNRGYA